MDTTFLCPRCQVELAQKPAEGLCPGCLLAEALKGDEAQEREELIRELLARRLPDYTSLEPVGGGGMGEVWTAHHPVLDRKVAVKLLSPERAAGTGFVERFRREAKVLAQLEHPRIVPIHDYGTIDDLCYIVMDYYPSTLREKLQKKRTDPNERLEWALTRFIEVCEAVEYAHDHKVIHRDIKPENILVGPGGGAVLADFGLALPEGVASGGVSGGEEHASEKLTQAGTRLGTPRYMAPEQESTPELVDHRADIYALGLVLHEMLTGELPTGNALAVDKIPDPRLVELLSWSLAYFAGERLSDVGKVKSVAVAILRSPPLFFRWRDRVKAGFWTEGYWYLGFFLVYLVFSTMSWLIAGAWTGILTAFFCLFLIGDSPWSPLGWAIVRLTRVAALTIAIGIGGYFMIAQPGLLPQVFLLGLAYLHFAQGGFGHFWRRRGTLLLGVAYVAALIVNLAGAISGSISFQNVDPGHRFVGFDLVGLVSGWVVLFACLASFLAYHKPGGRRQVVYDRLAAALLVAGSLSIIVYAICYWAGWHGVTVWMPFVLVVSMAGAWRLALHQRTRWRPFLTFRPAGP